MELVNACVCVCARALANDDIMHSLTHKHEAKDYETHWLVGTQMMCVCIYVCICRYAHMHIHNLSIDIRGMVHDV